ncbi:MAG: GDSL-type esterase/lipase family protein, partial [Acidobacteriota bacterium]
MKSLKRLAGMVLLASLTVAILSSCSTADESAAFAGDPSRPITVPPTKTKRPKILAFGDSLTAGFGLAQNESYPYLLQKRLDADGFEYEVVDAGLSGDTTVGGLDRIDWVLEGDGISIMILELGGND